MAHSLYRYFSKILKGHANKSGCRNYRRRQSVSGGKSEFGSGNAEVGKKLRAEMREIGRGTRRRPVRQDSGEASMRKSEKQATGIGSRAER